MAEALAAVSLVASVIQIVDFSQRFLRRLKEYQDKTNKLPLTFQAIQIQLPLIVNGLKVIEARAKQKGLPNESFHLIQPILEVCWKEIEKLDEIFSRLSLPSNTSSLSRGSRAIKTFRHNDDVQQSATILKDLVQTLILYQINMASDGTSSFLIQDKSHDGHNPEPPVDSYKNETRLDVSPLQERNDNANLWEKYLRLDRCTCTRRPIIHKSSQWTFWSAFWSADFSSQVLSMHKPGCIYFLKRKNLRKLSFNLNYTNLVLTYRLRVALSMQFGNGGMEIHPKLELRGVPRSNSPAFELIAEFAYPEDSQIPMGIDQLEFQMRRIFENGEASPFEINDELGETLMHAAYFALFTHTRSSNEDFHQRLGVLKTLHHFGVPLNEQDFGGCTVLQEALGNENDLESSLFATLIEHLIDGGAEEHEFLPYFGHQYKMQNTIEIMRISPEIAEYFNCNVLQFALLRRSFSTIKKIIRERPGLVAEQNFLGQNSLHLASDWPEATESLLSTGAKLLHWPDCSGLPPISYACMFKSLETVKILLANGSPLLSGWVWRYSNSAFDICEKYFCRDIFEIIASTLVQRRLELLRIAQQFLSEKTLREIIPQEEAVPDVSALTLVKTVGNEYSCESTNSAVVTARRRRTTEYRKLRRFHYDYVEYCSVYHFWTGPAEGAEILFNAGFRTILGKNKQGRSPLHSHRSFRDMTLIDWFYKKEVPFAKIEDFSTSEGIPNTNPNVHWLTLRASNSIYGGIRSRLHHPYKEQCNTFDGNLMEALRIILSEGFAHCVDKCKCSCSLAGCDPVAILLKDFTSSLVVNDYYLWDRLALLLKSAQCVLITLEGAPDWNKAGPISRSFVRFTLYEILGLQHVCCIASRRYKVEDFTPRFSEEDVDEIIEENRILIEKLEILLPMAQSTWEHTSKPWTRFWRDFYLDNIAADMDDPNEMDESYVERVVALGVRIKEEHQTEHQCTWVCHFEQPAKDDGSAEKQDEQSADLILLDYSRVVRKENFPIEDSSKPRAKNSSQFVCPSYDQRKEQGKILPF